MSDTAALTKLGALELHHSRGKETSDVAPRPAPSNNIFIVATGEQSIKPDDDTRKLIRRHARKGRGNGKRSRQSAQQGSLLGSWINQAHGQSYSSPSPSQDFLKYIPPFMGQGFIAGPHIMQPIADYIQSATQSTHPIEPCIDRSEERYRWFAEVNQDPNYINIAWYISTTYFAIAGTPTFTRDAVMHMNKAIALVQEKLAEPSSATADSTLFCVLALAIVSDDIESHDMAMVHLEGLSKLIKLRGGMASLAHRRALQLKACRLDIRCAMKNGTKPLFFSADSLSWQPYLVDIGRSIPIQPSMQKTTPLHKLCNNPDVRLVNVWLDLSKFCTAINLAHQTQRKLSSGLAQEALVSIQYRLQSLMYDMDDHAAARNELETVRLAMLAFSTTLMTEVQKLPSHYPHSTAQLEQRLQSLDRDFIGAEEEDRGKLILWLTFIRSLIPFDKVEDNDWVGNQLSRTRRVLGLTCWAEARKLIKGFLWVDIIHDEVGKRFFEQNMKYF
ncbi:hypothetical protein BX600DRAFT_251067 [Xylariales sp. PMI_506]|nr:hypothetical protein BX600DRAFT_251067 [Xylariales sp. PMI_506]